MFFKTKNAEKMRNLKQRSATVILAASVAAGSFSFPAYADEAETENKKAYEAIAQMRNEYEEQEKEITLGEDNLREALGISQTENKLAEASKNYAEKILEKYGYTDEDGDGTYETEYASCRVIVNAEVTDEDAALAASEEGLSVLQYESPEKAALAEDAFEELGYEAGPDMEVTVTTLDDEASVKTESTAYESEYMNLSCNAESGTEDVTVAFIDTGCSTSAFSNSDRFLTGYNAVNNGTNITDNNGHGTTTASIVYQYTEDNVSILPIKIMDGDGSLELSVIIAAISYAKNAGADVINMSIGIGEDEETAQYCENVLGTYLDSYCESGGIIVCAAGNESMSTSKLFPACHDSCWTISSIGSTYAYSSFTNYGEEVDFCAPGESITVITKSGSTGTASGTSYSSPLTAACAAQLTAIGYGNDDAYAYVQENCKDLGDEGFDNYYGYGMVRMAHSYTVSVTTEPTCTEAGEGTYVCSNCGDTYMGEIAAAGHTWNDGDVTTEPTCTEEGETAYTCTVCGETYTEAIEATGHSYEAEVTKAATCGEAGTTAYTCTACGDTYTETTEATGRHSYTSKVTKKATCTKSGIRKYTCSVCGDTYTKKIAKTGHSYTSKITKKATAGEAGVRTYTCKKCGDSYTVKIPATGLKAQTIKVTNTKKSYSQTKLKAKKKTFKLKGTANGRITYAKVSGSSAVKVSRAGKVTVKKGTKAGTYRIKVKVKAAKTDEYKAAAKTVTVTVKVKKAKNKSSTNIISSTSGGYKLAAG